MTELVEVERRLRAVIGALPPKVRSLYLTVLTEGDDARRAGMIGELYPDDRTRSAAELLIDAEEHAETRALLVAILRDVESPRSE